MTSLTRTSGIPFGSVLVGSALFSLVPVAPAVSQVSGAHLEEVIVTARKREVDIQDAPIAVSVISGQDFDQSNVVRLDNFNGYVPGLTIAKNDGAGRVVTIRGVGWETAQNLATQPSVLIYIDGIYLANPLAMGLDLGDIERVEVFRGPQGTEFGQGTTGGAINIITKKPVLEDFQGRVEFGYGTYDTIRARGEINVPLGSTAALRGSVQKYDHDGFAEIEGGDLDGYDLDDADSITGKASLLWQPNADWRILLSGFVQDSDQHAAAQKNVLDPNGDERELTQDFPGIFELRNYSASAVIEWTTPWWGIVAKSLTGWQQLEKDQSVDGDRLNEALTNIDVLGLSIFGVPASNWDVLPFWINDSDAVSEEVNFTYDGDDVDWVLGAYYLHHENFNHFLEANGPTPFSDFEDAVNNPSVVTLPPFASVLNFVEERTLARDDWAVYGQATFHFTDKLAVTTGGRYQGEEQLDEAIQFFGIFPVPDLRVHDHKFTWKVGLDYDVTDRNLLYGLLSSGFKNGGTNPGALRGGAIFLPVQFEPEEVVSFEVGSKNIFYDDRVRLNVTGFYYDYENLQFMQEDPVPFAGGTGNIPKTGVWGIESEFGWAITDGWQLDGMVTWMDGKFDDDFFALDVVDFREALAPGVGLFTGAGFATRFALATSTNLKGNEPPKLADISARLGLTNTHSFAGGSVLTSRVDYIHRGEFQARVWNNPLVDSVPDYDIVNLFFDYRFAAWPVNLSLGVTNLFDEDGVNNRFSNPFGLLTTSEEFIPPREVIGTIRYEF
ncbi:MAG: TonB-dependent receptor [Gammaproteobacteria bacterium]|nr:TonB-dependent receptor [Gammaproteobacteria bacterium]